MWDPVSRPEFLDPYGLKIPKPRFFPYTTPLHGEKQVYIAIHDGDADTYLRILKSDKVYKDDLRELLEHAARVFFDGGNRDGSALEALKEHGADVAECLNMAIAFRHTSIYMPLITHFEFDQEELQEFLHTVFCDGYDDSTSDETDEIIKCLVHKGLDFQKEGPHEEIPLVYAIKQGRLGVAETLLRAGATPNNVSDEVLEHAARFIDGSMVKLLIERGADVNIDSESEGTALHHIAVKAVALNDTRCLKLFMEAGAKERSATNDRYELTPMEYIQKEYGEDPTKARALNRAVDLLASFRKQ